MYTNDITTGSPHEDSCSDRTINRIHRIHGCANQREQMNDTMDIVIRQLNDAWQDLEHAIGTTYDEGYSALVWKLKQIQIQIENLEVEIQQKEYDDVEE